MNDEAETPRHELDGLLTADLLERIAELTGRLLQAEVALGADGPITGDALPAAIAALVVERDRLRAVVAWLRRAYAKLNITRHGLLDVVDSTQRLSLDADRRRHNVEAQNARLRAVVEQALSLGEDEGMQRGKTPCPNWWILLDRVLDENAEATDE
jgi:hypothetical protein